MRGLAVLGLLVALVALVSSETCTKSTECQETMCTGGDAHLGCSSGFCTCYQRNSHGIMCHTRNNCLSLRCDKHKTQHCIDNECHCSDTRHHGDDDD